MKAHAYIRVSSKAQDHATQRAAIEREAERRGDSVTFYAETASAKTMDRPELARLRADVRAGIVRRLYVFRLDRVARTGIRDTLEFVEECRTGGAELVSLGDGFDLCGPFAEVIIAVMAWAAKMERLAIGERIAAARERMEGEGRAWGRPPRLGAEEHARLVAQRRKGRTLRELAAAFKVPLSTVARACRKPPSILATAARGKKPRQPGAGR